MTFHKVVILSDIHILPDGGRIIGIDPTERLKLAIAHINRTQADASLCVITGDLTHYGDPQSYVILRELLAELTVPSKILIGNHDLRENFRSAFPDADSDAGGFVQFHVKAGGYNLIGLDSANQPRLGETRKGAGNLGNGRLDFLSQALDNADGQPSVIFLHHPPFDTGFPGMDEIKLMDADAFHQRLKGRDVRHIIMGHIHRSISVSWRGIPATVVKSLVDQMPFDLETIDSSLGVPEAPAYGVLLLKGDTVLCHTVDFLTELPEGKPARSIYAP